MMTKPLRRFLLIFLTLLQIVAPLVHAHAGSITPNNSAMMSGKLHIPGLETYAISQKAVLRTSDNTDNSVIIAIDTGMKRFHNLLTSDDDNAASVYLPPPTFRFTAAPPLRGFYVVSTAFAYVSPWRNHAHSPRAPPAR